jgi:hypothetical protein
MAYEPARFDLTGLPYPDFRGAGYQTIASYESELAQHRGREIRLRGALARDEALLRQKDELLTQRERLTLIVQKSAIPPPSRPRKIFVQKQRQRSLHTGFFFLDGILRAVSSSRGRQPPKSRGCGPSCSIGNSAGPQRRPIWVSVSVAYSQKGPALDLG